MAEQLGLVGALSIALGGMIGGGIFAVLGLVASLVGTLTWLAFLAAGVVAACAAYSYVSLNRRAPRAGGSVTYIVAFLDRPNLAGMVGWTLLFGYVGSMAMYAYAFGEFSVSLFGLAPWLRPAVSVLAVAGFVGLNLLGARASGSTEVLLVAAKVAILLALGLGGLWYGLTRPTDMSVGLNHLDGVGPLVAASISFVAFQGWQLLFYDQASIREPSHTIPRGVYLAIACAVGIYVLVAIVTTNLAAQAITEHPEVALAFAAKPMLGQAGMTIIKAAALFSTGSAINATLFSAAFFGQGMLAEGLLPDRVGEADEEGVPSRMVLLLGGATAVFTAFGTLDGITSFASLAFIVVFGAMSALAVRELSGRRRAIPAVGMVGCAAFVPLMAWHLATDRPEVFSAVVVISIAVLWLELVYFTREDLRQGFEQVAERL